MKKTLLLVSIPILVILFSTIGLLITKNTTNRLLKQENSKYECYLNRTIYGTEVATIINKAIKQNKNKQVQKDEKKHYIENNENSIKIEIKMLTTGKPYPMEEIYNNDMTQFVQNFNFIQFKCTKLEYHKSSGKVKKLLFEEVEEE